MDKGEIGHHHAKRLGPIHSADNLSASLQHSTNVTLNLQ
jgi:hypothetical protein